jgi:hypothetical protein
MHRSSAPRTRACRLRACSRSGRAETIGGNPGPQYNYICPHADGAGALDCYFDAVQHLYTMCRNVKSIEIIEFGYEDSIEGLNAAKYESCLDKQKLNMAALPGGAQGGAHARSRRSEACRACRSIGSRRCRASAGSAGETDYEYKTRVDARYDEFRTRSRHPHIVAVVKEKTSPVAARTPHRAEAGEEEHQAGKPAEPAAREGQDELSTALPPSAAAPPPQAAAPPYAAVSSLEAAAPSPPSAPDAALAHVFCDGGTLARTLPGFRFRAQQLAMAQAVADAIASRGQLVAEAGTGTGKTFAYLVPALMYGGKVIVSTGTKTLQDQLFERDLPLIRDALALPVTVAVLKGRANYVCHYHLERTAREGRLPSREDARHLARIVQFAQASERGDRGELADVPENATIWPLVTSTRRTCLGSDCPSTANASS